MADAVEDLYGLPLEEFTPARDAAAREIRRAGDRETAAQVAKLPKPTPAAWTANQVARGQPELIEAMLEAGGALREAQEAALSGAGGSGLRDATLAERRAVDAVMTAATAHRPAGRPLSRAMADRLRTTLHAAAADESIRTALAGGRLVSEAQAGGAWPFAVEEPAGGEAATGAGAGAGGRATAGGGATAKSGGAAKGGGAAKPGGVAKSGGAAKARAKGRGTKEDGGPAAERAAAAEREEREAAEQRKALEAELREARGALRVRERAVKAAEKAAERASRDAVDARERLEAARQAAEDAQADAEAAETLRDEARDALGQARDDVARLEERLD